MIHDFEIALAGATSEDVDESLGPGRFGMADETGRLLNGAITDGVGDGLGHRPGGRPVSRTSNQPQFAPRERACGGRIGSAFRSRSTSRSAPTSFTCIRPRRAPRSARASLRDFRYFVVERRAARQAACISIAAPPSSCRRSSSRPSRSRATAGVVARGPDDGESGFHADRTGPRPTSSAGPPPGTGRGYSLVGHHEIMIPLLAAAVVDADSRPPDADSARIISSPE